MLRSLKLAFPDRSPNQGIEAYKSRNIVPKTSEVLRPAIVAIYIYPIHQFNRKKSSGASRVNIWVPVSWVDLGHEMSHLLRGASLPTCQPTAHRFAFSDSASLRVGQARTDIASLRFVSVMMSSHRGAPDSPLTPGGVESSVSYGRRPLRESLNIRALPPSRRPRSSGERQTGVTGRFPERRAGPTFLADEMSAPADFQVSDAVSEERTSGRSDALSVRTYKYCSTDHQHTH